jgi:hypothetical protein
MSTCVISARARTARGGLPFALCVATAWVLSTTHVATDEPVSSNVRYTGEVVRIFDRKCAPCHGAGTLAMPLTSYREVRDWGRAIREEIVEQRMPPWSVARGYARVENELALTAREATTILSWLDGGMPRGEDRELPRAPASRPEEPSDLHLPIPAQHVSAREEHLVRRVTVPTNLSAARRLTRVLITPGNARVLRGALVFVEEGNAERWIGAWLPWQPFLAPPKPHSFLLPPGARLIVDLHYRGDAAEVEDAASLDLYFAKESPTAARRSDPRRPKVRSTPGVVPTGRFSGAVVREVIVNTSSPSLVNAETTVWAIVPLPDRSIHSLELTARRPDGRVDVLLWIPRWRDDWPLALALTDAITLPAGTTLTLNAEPRASTATARLSIVGLDRSGRSHPPDPPDP